MVFRIAILITIPVVIVLIVAAPILCVTVFGDEFRGSIDDLRVLAPGAFGITAMKLFGNALTAQRQPMLANAALAIAFGATIGLDLLLIPRYGGVGAAGPRLSRTRPAGSPWPSSSAGRSGCGSRLRSAPRRSRPAVGEPPRARRAPTEVE